MRMGREKNTKKIIYFCTRASPSTTYIVWNACRVKNTLFFSTLCDVRGWKIVSLYRLLFQKLKKTFSRILDQYKRSLQTQTKSKITIDKMYFSKKRFQKKHVAEGQIVTELTDAGCQKQTSKNDFRTSNRKGTEGFKKYFFAAQVPGVPYTAPSLPDPTSLTWRIVRG